MATPTRKELIKLLAPHIKVSTLRGVGIFARDFLAYIACISGALFLPVLWMQLIASILAGVVISNMLTVAHDAAHGSLTKSSRLNFLIGVVGMLPAWFSYRMWVYDHHIMHHAHTNGEHKDTFTPFTKAEFDAFPSWRRLLERFYRQLNPISFGVYYITQRWSRTKLFPHHRLPVGIRQSARKHFAFVLAVNSSYAGILLAAPLYSHNSSLMGVMLGMLLPFFCFMSTTAFFLWAMHTHPRIGWYRGAALDADAERGSELASVNLVMPRWFSKFGHDVMDHPVHHLCPAIPCYRLHDAQMIYNSVMGDRVIIQRGTLHHFRDTMRRCKLYDFQNNRWLDFDGNPTTAATSSMTHGTHAMQI